ncbi:MAG: DUF4177 domain-containing protein [Ruminococcaceae bacterium]|nr:DUF4177 domain-containing protein [Oscillospiraceae bacterium]
MPQYKVVQMMEREKFYDNTPSYTESLEKIMNEQAEAGYRLHTVLGSDQVSRSLRFDGSIRPQTTMIFEKINKEKE